MFGLFGEKAITGAPGHAGSKKNLFVLLCDELILVLKFSLVF